MREKLTDREKGILEFIIESKRRGITPSIREIGERFGLKSTATVFFHLKKLERKGYIKRGRGARSIMVLSGNFPLVGEVRAGKPNFAFQSVEDYIKLPIDIETHKNAFLLEVKGDSMKEAGILEGDIVVVDPDMEVRENDICVALIDGEETTIKRLRLRNGKIYLFPENKNYKPIKVGRNVKIIGKVIGVWRRY